jgi:hypothetical protein
MEEGKIKLTFRQSSGSQFEAVVNGKSTVRELKEAIVAQAGYSADEMRLIFKGKPLKERQLIIMIGKILKDENSLEEYKIENGCTLHIVKGKSAASADSQASATTAST